jgi:poly(ADP-ribose) glycohydrolase ARH3
MVASARADRVRGAILGAVVGDAFGRPLEGGSPGAMAQLVAGRAAAPSAWSYSDDGAMNIAVAESIAAAGTINPEHLLHRFAAHYEPARGFGRGMKLALRAFASGTSWDRCAFAAWPEGSRGNGGAVRITPVACVSWTSPAVFMEAVDMATKITHTHEEALSAARVHASAIALALETPSSGLDSQAFLVELQRRAHGEPAWIEETLLQIAALVERGAGHLEAGRTLGTSPLARESVLAALWAFLASGATYPGAVTAAAHLGGDVDSICAMAGALAGAVHGLSGIPVSWLKKLDHERPSVEEMIALCDEVSRVSPGGVASV